MTDKPIEISDDVLLNVEDRIATITINRPQVLNAITQTTIHELEATFKKAEQDPKVGVIVITGAGNRAFCAGGDVNWEKDGTEDEHYEINRMILESPKPVIAKVNGYAIGAGNHLAYSCDITIASHDAIMGQNGPRVGSPAAGYIVSYAAEIVGHKRARELWMLCRRYTAQEMFEMGFVNKVVAKKDLDAEVKKWANEMLALSPTCLKLIKASFREQIDNTMKTEMFDVIEKYAPNYFETGEQQEGANAFLEKRTPNFDPWR